MNGVGARVGRAADRRTDDPLALLQRCHGSVAAVRGWRRTLLAVVLGLIAVTALPPLYAWPALVPAFVGLFWLIDFRIARARTALIVGWWFGFGFFTGGLYWIFNAFMVRAEQFGWLAPFAVVGLAGVLAVFPALACLIARAARAPGPGGVVVFAAAWTVMEWLRGWIMTGFPWNLIGTAWANADAMIQSAALFGTLGLGFLTVLAAAMPAIIADPATPRARALTATGLAFLALLGVWAGGAARLAAAGDAALVDGVRLRLVQPNIPQRLKWRPQLLDEHLDRQLALGARPSTVPPTHVIWAEAAAPLLLAEDRLRLMRIARFTPAEGLTILGTLRRTAGEPFVVHNSLVAVDATGAVRATYDKAHLVPFGEYVPLRRFLGLSKLTEGTVDFAPGPGLATLRLPGLPPVGPLICYEVIFPGRVADPRDRPAWLLNLTNDGWYGQSAGPYQHFAAARMRAVEEGLPLVRVANTGISAVIDPYGRVVAHLGLGRAGVVDSPLPARLEGETLYSRSGDGMALSLAVLAGLAGWGGAHRRRRP